MISGRIIVTSGPGITFTPQVGVTEYRDGHKRKSSGRKGRIDSVSEETKGSILS